MSRQVLHFLVFLHIILPLLVKLIGMLLELGFYIFISSFFIRHMYFKLFYLVHILIQTIRLLFHVVI
jgi:hypothetical protein